MPYPPPPPKNPRREQERKDKQQKVPEHTSIAHSRDDRIAALRLIADSVAQQRQPAARSILFHPLYWMPMIWLFFYIDLHLFAGPPDIARSVMVWLGCAMASLVLVKFLVRGYLEEAEKIGWNWLYGEDCADVIDNNERRNKKGKNGYQRGLFTPRHWNRLRQDLVLISWFRGNIIGVVVLRVLRERARPEAKKILPAPSQSSTENVNSDSSSKATTTGCDAGDKSLFESTSTSASTTPTQPSTPPHSPTTTPTRKGKKRYRFKTFVRAWTVQHRYRGHGMGREILAYAVRVCHENGWDEPSFAEDHANSLRVLPWIFNWGLEDNEEKARVCLAKEIRALRE